VLSPFVPVARAMTAGTMRLLFCMDDVPCLAPTAGNGLEGLPLNANGVVTMGGVNTVRYARQSVHR